MKLRELNALDNDAAADALRRCCPASRWAQRMAAARPFAGVEAMQTRADAIWWALDPEDWREAFAAHPKIGAANPAVTGQGEWAAQEQAGIAVAAHDTLRRLAAGNRDYEARFGYIFIVCATGKTAAEMLALLEARVRHEAGEELLIAAEEQRKITRLRLSKLLEQEPDTNP